jgi:hypothetical protein
MNRRVIRWALGICAASLFILSLTGIGLRLVRISADGYASFCTHRRLKKGHNLDGSFSLIAGAENTQ